MKKKNVRIIIWFLVAFLTCGLVSRGIYAMLLPRITTGEIDYRTLSYRTVADGQLVAPSKEAVYGDNGLRIAHILVKKGQTVDENTQLYQYDIADLQSIIEEKQSEIEKLDIQIDTINYNAQLAAENKQRQQKRAAEDYEAAIKESGENTGNAQSQLNQSKQNLANLGSLASYTEKKRNADAQYKEKSALISQLQLQLQELIQQGGTQEQIENVEQQLEEAQKELEAYRLILDAEIKKQYNEQKAELEAAVNSEQLNFNSINQTNNKTITDTKRLLEDAQAADEKSSELALLNLEREGLLEKLQEYQTILDNDGIVSSQEPGVIVDIVSEEGTRVADQVLMWIADISQGLLFEAVIDGSQRKYVQYGDETSLTIGTNQEKVEGTITTITKNTNANSYTLVIETGKEAGNVGDVGEVYIEHRAENGSKCVPIEALHQVNNQVFVFVLVEQQTILGTQYKAVSKNITVNDSNGLYAAIEDGQLEEDDILITDSNKQLKEGATVRLLEP